MPVTRPGSVLFAWGCALEGALLIAAFGLAKLTRVPLLATVQWNVRDTLVGLAGCVPLLGLFLWLRRTPWKPVSGIARFLDEVIRPRIVPWPIWWMAIVSVVAGVSEEVFFRGFLQGGLAMRWGMGPALVAASLVFGFAHCVNAAYAGVAAVIGAALGGLWLGTGNLLAPIVTHASYEFVALVWLARSD